MFFSVFGIRKGMLAEHFHLEGFLVVSRGKCNIFRDKIRIATGDHYEIAKDQAGSHNHDHLQERSSRKPDIDALTAFLMSASTVGSEWRLGITLSEGPEMGRRYMLLLALFAERFSQNAQISSQWCWTLFAPSKVSCNTDKVRTMMKKQVVFMPTITAQPFEQYITWCYAIFSPKQSSFCHSL